MRTLAIDIETYSSVDLTKCGVYAYTASPDFEIILFGYAFDHEPTQLVDLASGEGLPPQVVKAIMDKSVIKTAYNSAFERICLSVYFKRDLPPASWRCTAVQAAIMGLPMFLAGVGKALELDEQKMSEGKGLIRYFCMPCKPTKSNGGRTRNLPSHAPEKWAIFKDYCKRDVDVERSIREKLQHHPITDSEQRLYELDQRINGRGIQIDMELVQSAIDCHKIHRERIVKEAKELTNLDNPNSVEQVKAWLSDRELSVESLNKKAVAELVGSTDGDIQRLLELRQEMSKTSIKKYIAIKRSVCPDNRVRGLLQHYGANRTGRWAGRLVQIHNLPQNHLPDLEDAREIVRDKDLDYLSMVYDSVPGVLSELIRTVFVAPEGYRFIVADFSAIEARVIAWLAGEQWRLDVFAGHGKIYEASASQMFKVPIESITKTSPLRQKGKIAELALGYGGSVGALTNMGALEQGLQKDELKPLVDAWRSANPAIVKYWWDIDAAATKAVKHPNREQMVGNLEFLNKGQVLYIKLPSGRKLAYMKPEIVINNFGRPGVTYLGIGENKQWCRIDTYGPKLVENIVQATSRDCLAEAMLRIDAAGYPIVMHVHDEVVTEMPVGTGSLEEVCEIMARPIPWAEGLFLKAAGFESQFYKKD
jgi:DNA polymerase